VLEQKPVNVHLAQINKVLPQFIGNLSQIPPMYSALKYQGKALYTYARAGVDIERPPRNITIYSLSLDEFNGDELSLQ